MLMAERYQLVELLGRGAMGEVWRAEDATLGREVAVKLLLDRVAVDHAAERFRQEAQTAARLNHPNVVAVYDFDEEEGCGYLVMELVSGSSLRDQLDARGAPDIDEARRIAGQAAAGLAAAHAHGVVHRDVKPGNLLLAADGGVKVADFGIARAAMDAASALTTTGAVLGTSAYLAPERGTGGPAGPASDVYALGCVLYEMLCGRQPFSGDPAAVVYQHVETAPPPPTNLRAELPAALADFVLRMLAKDPSERPTATEASDFLLHASPTGGGGEASTTATASAQSTHPLPQSREARPSRRTVVLTSTALAIVFAIAGAVGFQLNAGQDDQAHPPAPKPSASEPSRSPTGSAPDTAPAQMSSPVEEKPARESGDDEAAKKAAEEARKSREQAAKEAEEQSKKQEEEAKKAAKELQKQ